MAATTKRNSKEQKSIVPEKKKNVISAEKRQEYAQAIKEKFARERKRRKASGNTPEKMKFLYLIFEWMGMSYKDVAKLVGETDQNIVYHMTIIDDGKLSWVENILDKLGLKYRITFSDTEPLDMNEFNKNKETIQVFEHNEGDTSIKATIKIPENGVNKMKVRYKKNIIPQEMSRCIENNGRLTFLVELFLSCDMTLKEFCEKANVQVLNLYNAFKADDIKVSTIQNICRNLGKKMNWEIEPVESE